MNLITAYVRTERGAQLMRALRDAGIDVGVLSSIANVTGKRAMQKLVRGPEDECEPDECRHLGGYGARDGGAE